MDWDKQCRTCLSEDDGCISVFTQENIKDEEVLLAKIIHQLTGLEIFSYDGLPAIICPNCYNVLLQAYSFRQQSLVTNTFLRSKMQIIKIEPDHVDYVEFQEIENYCPDYEDDNDVNPFNSDGHATSETITYNEEEKLDIQTLNSDDGEVQRNDFKSVLKHEVDDLKPDNADSNSKACKNTQQFPEISPEEYTAPEENGPQNWKCNACGKIFQRKAEVRKHIARVHKGFRYKRNVKKSKPLTNRLCNICGQIFNSASLYSHHYQKHFPEKFPKCQFCGKLCSSPFQLTLHERVHTGEKPFKCEFCDYRASQKTSLKIHTRIHTGERPYNCNYCERTFRTATCRINHQRLVHTKERPHQCDQCDRAFGLIQELKQHQLTHSDEMHYKCEFCAKEFRFRKNWKVHVMTHTGERPHVCEICGAGFIQLHSLRTHLLTHDK